ncbi:NADH:ubiquinone oxidoreductase subunit K [Nocardia tenerifensis]|uniref:NADH:ubiquinone oxidoreductase subunit K n=1 Tax=Nocardia tenerifensis TaxID=228006 RepID=A0A318KM02_9NOCA|nr:DUF4190 domain-containing protein [Nocardia tenerifensis]PXX70680.1 NADH:ubiquinone oxidoreductase subunit K [Nocardia tenerifensis]
MARAQRRENERWPSAQPDDRWPAAGDEEQWIEPEPEERWQEPAPSRRRTGRLRVEIPPIVNPYAIVALVAALIGLFPVAIVFGFIAFSHPRGRVMAMFALLIGVAEVTAVAGLVLLSGDMLPDSWTRVGKTAATTSVAPPPVVPTTASPSTTNQSNLKKGASCTDGQVGQIGSATDGGTLICLLSSSGNYQWAGPYTVSTTVQQPGAKCDSTTAKTGRTADGRALVCESAGRSGTWVLWTE